MVFPDKPITLPNGRLVCYDHGMKVCHECFVDYSFMDDILDQSEEEDYDDDEHVTCEDEEHAEDEAIIQALSTNSVPMLEGSAVRFVPQTDYDRSEPSSSFSISTFSSIPFSHVMTKDCSECGLIWLAGMRDLDATCTHPMHNTSSYGSRSIFVFIDGACPLNGRADAYSGVGVHFGGRSSYNLSEPLRLPSSDTPTSQKAEVHAAIRALQVIQNDVMSDLRTALKPYLQCGYCHAECWRQSYPFRVVITTDSSYLVECMTSHLPKWHWTEQDQTYANPKSGKVIQNSRAIRALLGEVQALAKLGIEVAYYHVRREENTEADALARNGAQMALRSGQPSSLRVGGVRVSGLAN